MPSGVEPGWNRRSELFGALGVGLAGCAGTSPRQSLQRAQPVHPRVVPGAPSLCSAPGTGPHGLPSVETEGQGIVSCIAGGPGALVLVLPLVPSVTLANDSPSRDLGIPRAARCPPRPFQLRARLTCPAALLAGHALSDSSGWGMGSCTPRGLVGLPLADKSWSVGCVPLTPRQTLRPHTQRPSWSKAAFECPRACALARRPAPSPVTQSSEQRLGVKLCHSVGSLSGPQSPHGCGRVLGQRGHLSSCPREDRRVNAGLT